jgi:hypothetical protein
MAQQIKITQTSNADMNIGILKNLTAVEWLFMTLALTPMTDWYNVLEQAKAMEKEQIVDFAMQMHKIDCSKTGTDILLNEAEQYYNETYKK